MNLAPRPTAPDGATLVTHHHTRELPDAKSTNYITFMRLAASMRATGAIDALYHDGVHVAECARSVLAVNDHPSTRTPWRPCSAAHTDNACLQHHP